MKRSVIITSDELNPPALLAGRDSSSACGAVLCFLGIVRSFEADSPIQALEYEAFTRMADHQFGLLMDEVEKRWPVESFRVIHRLGTVKTGEPSLYVEVAAPHRAEAFEACQWFIDEMKRVVPIWKKALPLAPPPAVDPAQGC